MVDVLYAHTYGKQKIRFTGGGMEASTIILICGIILAMFGTIDGLLMDIGVKKINFIFFLIALLAFSGQKVELIQEIILAPAPFVLMALATKCRRQMRGAKNFVMTLLFAIFAAGVTRMIESELVVYAMALGMGILSMVLALEPGNAILFGAYIWPTAYAIIAVVEFIMYSYAEFDMYGSGVLNLQLVSAGAGAVLCRVRKYTYKLVKRRIA